MSESDLMAVALLPWAGLMLYMGFEISRDFMWASKPRKDGKK